MLNWKRLLILGAGFFSVSLPAHAGVSPIGISIVHKVGFPPADFSVTGVRASALWGVHRNVYGFDFGGLGNVVEQNFSGLAVSGGFNYNQGTTTVLFAQVAGVTNMSTPQAKLKVYGVQVAGLVNSAQAEAHIIGIQVAGIANLAPHATISFLQVGAFNRAHKVYGFQIGVINQVNELRGLQIGLLNFNKTGTFAIAPIINVGF